MRKETILPNQSERQTGRTTRIIKIIMANEIILITLKLSEKIKLKILL